MIQIERAGRRSSASTVRLLMPLPKVPIRDVSSGFMSVTGNPVLNRVMPEIDQPCVQRLSRERAFRRESNRYSWPRNRASCRTTKAPQKIRIERIDLVAEIGTQVERLAVGIAEKQLQAAGCYDARWLRVRCKRNFR